MKQEIILKRKISVGQKTATSGNFGEGFNYSVEAGFPHEHFDSAQASIALEGALRKVDHKALGVDVDLGFEPTSQSLCVYLAGEIERRYVLSSFRMVRGDGEIFEAQFAMAGR